MFRRSMMATHAIDISIEGGGSLARRLFMLLISLASLATDLIA